MRVIDVRNVHQALPTALRELQIHGIDRDSRNGPVRMFPGPVTTVYDSPTERVILWAKRDANPFFHLFESLWMLAGRNDLKFLTYFVKTMANYSDDGKTLHGAYGHRWRRAFRGDQLSAIINLLRKNYDDRRCVLQMWDAEMDLGRDGKDVPCNTHAFFSVNNMRRVDMTVLNRSNDMVWGAYGANAVHFSILQEYVAAGVGLPVGTYYQVSNNLHAYLNTLGQVADLAELAPLKAVGDCPYADGIVEPYPLVNSPLKEWDEDLLMFLEEGPIVGLRDPFFRRVVIPMWCAFKAYKEKTGEGKYEAPLEILRQCHASDWRAAAEGWIMQRRLNAKEKKDVNAS